jgi:hypothetical protein
MQCTTFFLLASLIADPVCSQAEKAAAAPPAVLSTQNIPDPIEKVWPKVMQFLALKSIVPSMADKTAGIINASGPINSKTNVDCSRNKGKLGDFRYNLAISLNKVSDSETSLTVMLNGEANNIRRRHFLVIPTTTVKTPVPCTSTGLLEKELFQYLAQLR